MHLRDLRIKHAENVGFFCTRIMDSRGIGFVAGVSVDTPNHFMLRKEVLQFQKLGNYAGVGKQDSYLMSLFHGVRFWIKNQVVATRRNGTS